MEKGGEEKGDMRRFRGEESGSFFFQLTRTHACTYTGPPASSSGAAQQPSWSQAEADLSHAGMSKDGVLALLRCVHLHKASGRGGSWRGKGEEGT